MIFTKETLKRALRTFVQSALSYLIINLAVADFSTDEKTVKTLVMGLCISSCAAGLAAAMNLEKGDFDDLQGVC